MMNRIKTNYIHAYKQAAIEEMLQTKGGLKETHRKLATGKDRMYALRETSKVAAFRTTWAR